MNQSMWDRLDDTRRSICKTIANGIRERNRAHIEQALLCILTDPCAELLTDDGKPVLEHEANLVKTALLFLGSEPRRDPERSAWHNVLRRTGMSVSTAEAFKRWCEEHEVNLQNERALLGAFADWKLEEGQ